MVFKVLNRLIKVIKALVSAGALISGLFDLVLI